MASAERQLAWSVGLGLAGVLVLGLGAAVYVFQRPPGSLAWFPALAGAFELNAGAILPWGSLPDFCHALGFGLLSAVVWGVRRRGAVGVAVAWGLIDGVAECFQHPAVVSLLPALPAVSEGSAPAAIFLAYFHHGTFDPADLVAFAAASLVAGGLTAASSHAARTRPAPGRPNGHAH